MPVSTRSQIATGQDEAKSILRARPRPGEVAQVVAPLLRNPHHGLKEKMKTLTLLYDRQQQESAARFSTHPSVDLLGSQMKEEKQQPTHQDGGTAIMRETENRLPAQALPMQLSETKEEKENVKAFSCPKKDTGMSVFRKLSLSALPPPLSELRPMGRESRVGGGNLETVKEDCAGGSRILVFVRLRPMAKKEKEAGSRSCVRIVNKSDVFLTEFASEHDYLRLKRVRGRHFTFDASFTDSTTQQEVYSTTTADLVEGVLQGRNGSVFCYGATGAGKTYTMLGTVENPGVMVLAIKDLFSKIRQRSYDGSLVVHLSYLEVYNETVRDLISPGRPLLLREDKQGIVAAGLTQYRAYSTDEVMALLQQGNQNRTTEPTRANETSSRSHAILQVRAEYRVRDGTNIVPLVGKLSLIDLAGSERALATDQRTQRSLEGANINRSLLALSSCINALVEGKKHIPYRNSKLTQLLKDSLGGACNTVMIANISPSNLSLGESQNTLHWADRAKEIRTQACPMNEEWNRIPESEADKAKLVIELKMENHELRMQLTRQQQSIPTIQAQDMAAVTSFPAPSTVSSALSPLHSAQQPEKKRPKSSLLVGTCFDAPETKKKASEDEVKALKVKIKTLQAVLDNVKKDHALQIKQKDDIIRELSENNTKAGKGTTTTTTTAAATKRIVTRASLKTNRQEERLRTGHKASSTVGELKSPSHRFKSPAPTARKRSFWDITSANSPSVTNLHSRKTRSLIQAPSMLLQRRVEIVMEQTTPSRLIRSQSARHFYNK